MGTLAITGAETMYSGDLDEPRLDGADTVICRDGTITAVGAAGDLAADLHAAGEVIELDGGAVGPGLIDSHGHLTFGDYTPRPPIRRTWSRASRISARRPPTWVRATSRGRSLPTRRATSSADRKSVV